MGIDQMGHAPGLRGRRRRAEHETLQGLRLLHPMAMPARWRFPERTDWFHLTGLTRDTDGMPPIELGNILAQPSHSIILHPGNHGSAAGWSILRFEDLASRLLERGMRVIITGTQDERPALDKLLVNHAGDPPLGGCSRQVVLGRVHGRHGPSVVRRGIEHGAIACGFCTWNSYCWVVSI